VDGDALFSERGNASVSRLDHLVVHPSQNLYGAFGGK
jgi:hypothetical protein